MTYEVRAYNNKREYEKYLFTVVVDNVVNKKDACLIAINALSEYEIVKIQSSDSNFVEIFTRLK